MAESVTTQSKADYTCYTLRGNDNQIVAVIIEANMSKRCDHVLAHCTDTLQYVLVNPCYQGLYGICSAQVQSHTTCRWCGLTDL